MSNSPFSRRHAYLTPSEADIVAINRRPSPQDDVELAQRNLKHNRTLKNVGIVGFTAIGALAVTFAALKTYLWGNGNS